MKTSKILALLLALAMVVCMFSACGSSDTAATTAETAETTVEETAEAVEETAEAATEAVEETAEAATEAAGGIADTLQQSTENLGNLNEMTSAEMAEAVGATSSVAVAEAVAAVAAGDYTSAGGIHYPLGDGDAVVTFWDPFGFGWESYLDSWNDMVILPYLKEATGVEIVFDCVSQSAATEQFQLYIAGGDYSDIMQPGDYYTGGLGQAYEDEVIIDLTDLLPTNSPDYWTKLMALDQDTIDGVTTDDMHLGYVVIYNANWADQGNICIANYAEELGYEVVDDILQVNTIDEYSTMLKEIKDTYNMTWTVLVDSDDGGDLNLGSSAFEGPIANISADATSLGVNLMGDTVVAAATTDSFRAYAEWFYDMYAYGVINEDFYAKTFDNAGTMAEISQNNMFQWLSRADSTDQFKDYLTEESGDLESAILGRIYAYEGQEDEYPSSVSLVDNKQFVITTSCEQVDLVMQYLNFGFTEGGYELYNWGVEGESFYIDEEGEYHYTDLIWNNPDGIGFMMASSMQVMGQLPRYDEHGKLNDGYTAKQLNAQDAWTVGGEDTHTIPNRAGLTTEESNSIINMVNDCLANLAEWGLKFYTGSLEINDANWADFQAALVNSGINEIVAVYQAAYDDYLAGGR